MNYSETEIKRMREEAANEVRDILTKLEKDYPGMTEGAATALGASAGAAGSFATLVFAGTTGLSAAGITSGLAAAGSIIGGGMVAGIGVLAAPVAILGIGGYALAKQYKNKQLTAALGEAISKLYTVQERLLQNAEYFKDEIAGIKATIELLTSRKA